MNKVELVLTQEENKWYVNAKELDLHTKEQETILEALEEMAALLIKVEIRELTEQLVHIIKEDFANVYEKPTDIKINETYSEGTVVYIEGVETPFEIYMLLLNIHKFMEAHERLKYDVNLNNNLKNIEIWINGR